MDCFRGESPPAGFVPTRRDRRLGDAVGITSKPLPQIAAESLVGEDHDLTAEPAVAAKQVGSSAA
mgnify:CR=1 FL=1